MIIGILSVKNHRYHPNRRLIEAARGLNHEARLINPKKAALGAGQSGLSIDALTGGFDIDVLIPRLGSSIKDYGLTMVRQFELSGVPVINRFRSIILAKNKFLTLQTLARRGLPIVESRYASNRANFAKAVSRLGGLPVVVKAPKSRQGRGVSLIRSLDRSRRLLDDLLNGGEGLLVQKFIPPEERRDIRAFILGKKVIGAVALTPRRGDFRANVHLRARAEKIRLKREVIALAVDSSQELGLDISGVDMIEDKDGLMRILEVNYAPGFRGMERCTGKDIAAEIIRYALRTKRRPRCK